MQLQSSLIQGQYMKLGLTPQQIFSMHILQMSMADLAHYIQEYSMENPFLDVVVYHGDLFDRRKKRHLHAASSNPALVVLAELAGSEAETLETVLLSQLRINKVEGKTLKIAKFLAGNVNDDGILLAKVVEAIVQEQILFLEHGISCLKPMNLKTIATRLHIDESTVSRTIRNKFVQTPRGILELKNFFSKGLMTYKGDAASAKSVKAKIIRLIENEKKAKPLSDQQITDILAQDGLQISRRTVMKYREEMNILSSRLRVTRAGN